MSLFDVIRYPITNIYNKEELDRIPKEIIISWVEIWIARLGGEYELAVDADWRKIDSYAYLMQWIFQSDTVVKLDTNLIDGLEEWALSDLRRRIEQYDSI